MNLTKERLSQISTNVSFSSFMTAVVIFFIGVLISRFDENISLVKIPVAILVVGTVGFLYSAIIYANACGEIINGKVKNFSRNMLIGDVLSEYLGVYPLIISIPLAMNVLTTDSFLRIVTAVVCFLGLTFYQFSHFSISERHFPKMYRLISVIIIVLGILLFLSQRFNFYFEYVAISLIVFVFSIVFLAIRKKLWAN